MLRKAWRANVRHSAYTEGAWLFPVKKHVLVVGAREKDESPLPEGWVVSPETQCCAGQGGGDQRSQSFVERGCARTQWAGRLWKHVGQPTWRSRSSRKGEGRLGRGEGRGPEVGVFRWGGWGELEEGEGSGLKPERRAGVHREKLSLEGGPGDQGGVLGIKGR